MSTKCKCGLDFMLIVISEKIPSLKLIIDVDFSSVYSFLYSNFNIFVRKPYHPFCVLTNYSHLTNFSYLFGGGGGGTPPIATSLCRPFVCFTVYCYWDIMFTSFSMTQITLGGRGGHFPQRFSLWIDEERIPLQNTSEIGAHEYDCCMKGYVVITTSNMYHVLSEEIFSLELPLHPLTISPGSAPSHIWMKFNMLIPSKQYMYCTTNNLIILKYETENRHAVVKLWRFQDFYIKAYSLICMTSSPKIIVSHL